MPFNRQKALYQPWNEEEFIADQIVQSMNSVQRWMYRTLLQQAFFCSTRPRLPDDDDQLWRLAGANDREQWEQNRGVVLTKFSKIERKGKNLLKQKRLELDWKRERKRRETLAKNGHKGGTVTQARLRQGSGDGSSTELNRTGPNGTELNLTELNLTEPNLTERTERKAAKGEAGVSLGNEATGQTQRPETYPPDVAKVVSEITYLSDGAVILNGKRSVIIAQWLETSTADEIIEAFDEFWMLIDHDVRGRPTAFALRNAAQTFCEKGTHLIEFGRRKEREDREDRAVRERNAEAVRNRTAIQKPVQAQEMIEGKSDDLAIFQ